MNQESSRCAICAKTIEHEKEKRIIRSAGKVHLVHALCLMRLRRLACDMDGRTLPIPTLSRALTLNEFLLTKRPKTGFEIFSCVVYYHHEHGNNDVTLTLDCVRDQLRYSPYKITNIHAAANEAVALGLTKRLSSTGAAQYILTRKGRGFVQHLPVIFE